MSGLLARGRARWPDLALSDVDEARVAEAMERHRPADVEASVWAAQVNAEELYLAAACALQHPRAHVVFDGTFLSPTSDYVRAVDSSASFADEVRQVLREKLLVRGKIGAYAGRGALGGWVRLAAVRAARDLRRSDLRRPTAAASPEANAGPSDPELELLRARCGAELRAALEGAVLALEPQERTMLKLHFLEGMTTDAIGRLFGVDGATVRRRTARVRERILQRTRAHLREQLDLRERELDSMLALVQSDFEASVSRWLSGD